MASTPECATRERVPDEPLRLRALEALGPLGDELARAALEAGVILVEHDVRTWEGSHGTVHAHRVVLVLPAELHARVAGVGHAAQDALAAALAAAMAEHAGHAVADVAYVIGRENDDAGSPYRSARISRV